MRITALICLLATASCITDRIPGQESSGVVLTRIGPREYLVESTDVVWRIGDVGIPADHPDHLGAGQLRLLNATRFDQTLLSCGDCGYLQAISLDGRDTNFAGGEHGMESDAIVTLYTASGAPRVLPGIGESMFDPVLLRMRSQTVLFTRDEHHIPVPVVWLEFNYVFQSSDALITHVRAEFLQDAMVHTVRDARIDGPRIDGARTDGIWDTWMVMRDGFTELIETDLSGCARADDSIRGDTIALYSASEGISIRVSGLRSDKVFLRGGPENGCRLAISHENTDRIGRVYPGDVHASSHTMDVIHGLP